MWPQLAIAALARGFGRPPLRCDYACAHGVGQTVEPDRQEVGAMTAIQESIEVEVPLSTAYNLWTQFEEFPRFMEGVDSIEQLDDRRPHWVASHGGNRHQWDAEIVDQTPDSRVAWRDVTGKTNAGEVTF